MCNGMMRTNAWNYTAPSEFFSKAELKETIHKSDAIMGGDV